MTRVTAADRRQQFIDATIRTIGAHGLAAATTRRIAQEAGASLASLHYCFGTKDDLIAAAWEERVQRIVDAAEHAIVPGQPFREAVHRITDHVWETISADPGGQIAQYELMFHYSRNHRDRAGRWAFDRQAGRILRALEKALAESGETLTIDMMEFLRLTTLALEGALLQHVSYRDSTQARADLYRVHDAIISLALVGDRSDMTAR